METKPRFWSIWPHWLPKEPRKWGKGANFEQSFSKGVALGSQSLLGKAVPRSYWCFPVRRRRWVRHRNEQDSDAPSIRLAKLFGTAFIRSAASSSTSTPYSTIPTSGMKEKYPAKIRPHKDQPFYHLFAEGDETEYVAYVSERNLLPDTTGEPVRHPQVAEGFIKDGQGGYRPHRPRSTGPHEN